MKFGFAADLNNGNRVGIDKKICIGCVAEFSCGLLLKQSCISICRNKCGFFVMHSTSPTYVEHYIPPAGASDCTIAFNNCNLFLSERNCPKILIGAGILHLIKGVPEHLVMGFLSLQCDMLILPISFSEYTESQRRTGNLLAA